MLPIKLVIVKSCNTDNKVICGKTKKKISIDVEKDSAISINKFKKEIIKVKLTIKVPHNDKYQSIKLKIYKFI